MSNKVPTVEEILGSIKLNNSKNVEYIGIYTMAKFAISFKGVTSTSEFSKLFEPVFKKMYDLETGLVKDIFVWDLLGFLLSLEMPITMAFDVIQKDTETPEFLELFETSYLGLLEGKALSEIWSEKGFFDTEVIDTVKKNEVDGLLDTLFSSDQFSTLLVKTRNLDYLI